MALAMTELAPYGKPCSLHTFTSSPKKGGPLAELKALAEGWLWFEPSFIHCLATGVIVFRQHQTTFAIWPKKAQRSSSYTLKPKKKVTSPQCFLLVMKWSAFNRGPDLTVQPRADFFLRTFSTPSINGCGSVVVGRPPQWALEAELHGEKILETRTNLEGLIKQQKERLMNRERLRIQVESLVPRKKEGVYNSVKERHRLQMISCSGWKQEQNWTWWRKDLVIRVLW